MSEYDPKTLWTGMQGFIDQFGTVLRNLGYRYVVETVFVIVFALFVHYVAYPAFVTPVSSEAKAPLGTSSPTAQPIAPVTAPQQEKERASEVAPSHERDTRTRPPKYSSPALPSTQIQSAPNGIAIGGNNYGNPTVNNFGKPFATRKEDHPGCYSASSRHTE